MATYSILITSPPYKGQNAQRAIAFARTAIAEGHTVNNVFFYGDGVHHANDYMVEVGGEFYPLEAWKALHNEFGVTLLLCITAAIKHGVLSKQEADINARKGANLATGFDQAGLGEFFAALHHCDKVVQF